LADSKKTGSTPGSAKIAEQLIAADRIEPEPLIVEGRQRLDQIIVQQRTAHINGDRHAPQSVSRSSRPLERSRKVQGRDRERSVLPTE